LVCFEIGSRQPELTPNEITLSKHRAMEGPSSLSSRPGCEPILGRASELADLQSSKVTVKHLTGTEVFTNIVVERDREVLEVLGPTIQFLVAPQSSDETPCVLKGTIPPGVSVPIHSHPGIEAFYLLSGQVEVLSEASGKPHWIAAGPGDFIEVPSSAKHGFRNRSQQPVVQLITTTSKLGRFFQEIGRSIRPRESVSPPSPDDIQRFLQIAERYGYWLATPEENAALGISLL
jgi:quercetin dioxygenase-like cupin family protein